MTFFQELFIAKQRQIEVLNEQGQSAAEAVRTTGINVQNYYRWCKEYGGIRLEQAGCLKDLEMENQRIKKLVAGLSLG